MVRLTDRTARARLTLGVDVGAIVVFVLAGMTSHHDDGALTIFLRNFVPFTTAWVIVSWILGTYRPPANASLVRTLLIAIPVGVVVRVAWVRAWDSGDVITFAAVALLFASLFVGVGRVLSTLIGARLFDEPARPQ